jgi:hypothetical protein
MKRIFTSLFLATLIFVSSASHAQLRKIPAEVTDAFKEKYPSASGVEWKDKLSVFQANFELNGVKCEAKFNTKGEWQETLKEMEQDKLPAAVTDGFSKSKYTEWEIREVSFLEKKDSSEQYRILVKKSDLEKKYLFFDKSGKLIKDSITL